MRCGVESEVGRKREEKKGEEFGEVEQTVNRTIFDLFISTTSYPRS